MIGLELAGTLFVPASHKDLKSIVGGVKYPSLKSVLIDTEDSISDETLDLAIESIKDLLGTYVKSTLLVFIRPRNNKTLEEILLFKNIEKINGFILPKFSLSNADLYLETLRDSKHIIMPSIEGEELFDSAKLIELKNKLLTHKDKISLVRFGLEDMLAQLKMRRVCEDSIFDISVTSSVIGNFISIFKSSGFEVSGGVYPCFKDSIGFEKDVLRDLKEGLISKTIIHPNQINIINELYKVKQKDYDEALAICNSSNAVFNQTGKMAETTTMLPYSQGIIKRAKLYGIK